MKTVDQRCVLKSVGKRFVLHISDIVDERALQVRSVDPLSCRTWNLVISKKEIQSQAKRWADLERVEKITMCQMAFLRQRLSLMLHKRCVFCIKAHRLLAHLQESENTILVSALDPVCQETFETRIGREDVLLHSLGDDVLGLREDEKLEISRAKLEVIYIERRRQRSSVKIQSVGRGYVGREKVKELRRHKAALQIELLLRGYFAVNLYQQKKERKSAIAIQSCIRGFLSRKQTQTHIAASLEIVQMLRKHLALRQLTGKKNRQTNELIGPAVCVQVCWKTLCLANV